MQEDRLTGGTLCIQYIIFSFIRRLYRYRYALPLFLSIQSNTRVTYQLYPPASSDNASPIMYSIRLAAALPDTSSTWPRLSELSDFILLSSISLPLSRPHTSSVDQPSCSPILRTRRSSTKLRRVGPATLYFFSCGTNVEVREQIATSEKRIDTRL